MKLKGGEDMENRIREKRLAKKMTQREMAKKAKITQSMLSLYETGTRTPNAGIACRIAAAVDCRVEDIFCPN